MSKMTISISISPLRLEPSPSLHPNPISIWYFAEKGTSRGKSLCAKEVSISE
jgi:hypothetical protein